jgi:UDP-glucose 4-epimerase
VVPRFITALLEGRPPTIYGDGEQSRDFTYVANVVQANLLACTAPGAAGGVFNIACGSRITVNELLRTLAEITGNSTAPVHTEPRPGDVRHSLADITAAQEKLGYKPAISFLEGLEKTVAWYRTQLKKGGSKR